MSTIPNENYVAFYDGNKPEHRAWLLGVLDHLTAKDPSALSRGYLRDLWSAPGAAPVDEEVALALPLIRGFEGCRLAAYPDPLSGGAPWTIGWGSASHLDGRPVAARREIRRGGVVDPVAGLHRGPSERDREHRLAHPRRPDEQHVRGVVE